MPTKAALCSNHQLIWWVHHEASIESVGLEDSRRMPWRHLCVATTDPFDGNMEKAPNRSVLKIREDRGHTSIYSYHQFIWWCLIKGTGIVSARAQELENQQLPEVAPLTYLVVPLLSAPSQSMVPRKLQRLVPLIWAINRQVFHTHSNTQSTKVLIRTSKKFAIVSIATFHLLKHLLGVDPRV